MADADRPVAAFVISLVSGIFIVLGGLEMSVVGMWGAGMMRIMSGMTRKVPGIFDGMYGMSAGFQAVTFFGLIGIAAGVAVLVGAVMLNAGPKHHSLRGAVILVFSIISLIGAVGGFLVGFILGVVGGALALGWKPSSKSR